jgi:uncharacterized protein YbcV (DUF1398 family)
MKVVLILNFAECMLNYRRRIHFKNILNLHHGKVSYLAEEKNGINISSKKNLQKKKEKRNIERREEHE